MLTRLVCDALQQTFLQSVCSQSVCQYVLVCYSTPVTPPTGKVRFILFLQSEIIFFLIVNKQSGCRQVL